MSMFLGTVRTSLTSACAALVVQLHVTREGSARQIRPASGKVQHMLARGDFRLRFICRYSSRKEFICCIACKETSGGCIGTHRRLPKPPKARRLTTRLISLSCLVCTVAGTKSGLDECQIDDSSSYSHPVFRHLRFVRAIPAAAEKARNYR